MDRIFCRHISRIFAVFLFFCFLIVVFPQAANAASSHVQLGGKALINDGREHSWNDSGASISGWTSGSYSLSADSSTLRIKGLNFSTSQVGVTGLYSDTPLTIIASGTNSIKAERDGILIMQGADFGSLAVSGTADSSLTVTTTADNNTEAIMASSGSFNSIKLTAECINNKEYGIYYTGDLAIKNSTVTASSLSAGTFTIEDNSTVRSKEGLHANASTGTSSISRSLVIAYKSALIFNPLEIKDNAAFTGGEIHCDKGLTQSSGLVTTLNGAVTLYEGNYDGSGGSLTARTDIIVRNGDMTLKGTAARASTGKVYVGGNLKVSGGSLSVDKDGVYVGGNLGLSGSGNISTSAQDDNTAVYKAALQVVGKFIIDGGTLQAFENGSEGNAITVSGEAVVNGGTVTAAINNSETNYSAVQFDSPVYLQGGQFTATAGPRSTGISCQSFIQVNNNAVLKASGGARYGIDTLGAFILNSGTVTASSQNNYSICTGKFQMKGGKLVMYSGTCSDLVSSSQSAYLAGDIWISAPADGTIHFDQDPGYILSSDGAKASKAVLQKVDSISINTAPDEALYPGEMFDTDSLVLNVEFADGSMTPLTYKTHTDMITLDPSQYADLLLGDNQIQVSCFTKTTSFHVNVRGLGGTTLKVSNTGRYVLSWSKTGGATGYEIWRGKGASGSRTLLTTVGNVTSFTDTSADIYTVYHYMVVPIRVTEEGTFRGKDSNIAVTKASAKPVIKPPKKDDPSGTKFKLLQARSGKITKTSVQVKWKKVSGAKKYIIYGNKCGTKNKYKRLKTTAGTKFTFKKVAGKKVKKGTYYKFIVYAVDKNGKTLSTSKTVHVATPGGKYGNDKSIKTAAKQNKVTLRKGKTFKLKAKAVPASKKHKVQRHRKMAYETSNNKIAKVTSKGVIKAVGKGKCYVYAYTQNGLFTKIKVTVK